MLANWLWNNYELLFEMNPNDTSLVLFFGGSVPGKFRREFYRKEELCADVLKALEHEMSKQPTRRKKKVSR